MTRKKVQFEYGLNYTSESILWDAISTPSGLKEWFADQVKFDGKNVTFKWGKDEERSAVIVGQRIFSFIRFKWTDATVPQEYFEMKILVDELTNDFTLEITDFCEEGEEIDTKDLWDSQIETLRRMGGF